MTKPKYRIDGHLVHMAASDAADEAEQWASGLRYEYLRAKCAAAQMRRHEGDDSAREYTLRNWRSSELALGKVRSVVQGMTECAEGAAGGQVRVVEPFSRAQWLTTLILAFVVAIVIGCFGIAPTAVRGYEARSAAEREERTARKVQAYARLAAEIAEMRQEMAEMVTKIENSQEFAHPSQVSGLSKCGE